MLDRERIKKVLETYCENANNQIEKRGGVFFEFLEQKEGNKDYILPYKSPLWKKSENLKSFLHHRQTLDKKTRTQFLPENKIPFVLRLHHLLKKNRDFFENVDEVLKYHTINQLGCHNIADRISVKNPKTIKSVRTFFSYPHYGRNKEFLEHTKGVVKFSSNGKRVVDSSGKMWISHSINAIKNGNEFHKNFGGDSIEELPFTERNGELKDYSQTTFNLIGNDVLFDADIDHLDYKGIFYSFDYIKRDEFDFGDFNDEELLEVERWLDYEWISLSQNRRNHFFLPSYTDNTLSYSTFNEIYLSIVRELVNEKGVSFILPLILFDKEDRIRTLAYNSISEGKSQLGKHILSLKNNPTELHNLYERWENRVEEHYRKSDKKFEYLDDNLEIREDSWFLPIPDGFTTKEELIKLEFDAWTNSGLRSIDDYKS